MPERRRRRLRSRLQAGFNSWTDEYRAIACCSRPPVRMKKTILPLLLLVAAATASASTPKLPLIEVPSTGGNSDTLVVFVSGDGGWAPIDREIAKVFAANGMPVVGLNALQYFWTKRTPENASRDLRTIINHYL